VSANVRGKLNTDPQSLISILQGADICMLQDIGVAAGMTLPAFPGYTGYYLLRHDGSLRGDVAIYVRADLERFTTHWEEAGDDALTLWLRIDQEAGFDQDLLLFCTYLRPLLMEKQVEECFDNLEAAIPSATAAGYVIGAGDFNAHTGAEPDRWSQDSTRSINPNGRKLRRLQDGRFGVKIGNGRIAGPSSGNFTFWDTRNRRSVIDYVLVCANFMARATGLKVEGPPPENLDHCVLRWTAKLGARAPAPAATNAIPLRTTVHYAMDDAHLEDYVTKLQAAAPQLQQITQQIEEAETPEAGAAAVRDLMHLLETQAKATGAPRVKTGRTHKRDPRQARRTAINADSQVRALRRQRKQAKQNREFEEMRKLDGEIQRLKRALMRRLVARDVERLEDTARRSAAEYFKELKHAAAGAPAHDPATMLDYCIKLLGETPLAEGSEDEVILPAALCGDGDALNHEFTLAEAERALVTVKGSKTVTGFLTKATLTAIWPSVGLAVTAALNSFVRVRRMPTEVALSVINLVLKPGATTTALDDTRTITVGTLLGKLYSICIARRLSAWGEENKLRADTQTGFRVDHQTLDNVEVLRFIKERYDFKGEPVYAAFIDFRKAYDCIPRDKLFKKLQARGITGWFRNALDAEYYEVPLSVKTAGGLTDSFLCKIGLTQGKPDSPDLYGFYTDDLPAFIKELGAAAAFPVLNNVPIDPLLHADDTALLATTIEGLQAQLDKLKDYADRWGLTISIKKTAIMQLSGAGAQDDLEARPKLQVGGEDLPWVREFKYLGVLVHETEDWDKRALAQRLKAARMALAALRHKLAVLGGAPPARKAQLYQTNVETVLTYGIGLWGPGYLLDSKTQAGDDEAEVMYRKFLRRELGVGKTTHNLITYAEFGAYPLRVLNRRLVVSHWDRLARLVAGGNRPTLTAAVLDNMQLAAELDGTLGAPMPWAGKMRAVLQDLGLDLDLNAPPAPCGMKPEWVQAVGQQQHLAAIKNATGSRITTYRSEIRGWTEVNMLDYIAAPYVWSVMPRRRLTALTRLRTSSHRLRVETDRYLTSHPPREARTCRLCDSGCVEDERHITFGCQHPSLQQLRESYSQCFEYIQDHDLAAFLKGPQNQVAGFFTAVFEAGEFERRYEEQRPTAAQRRAQRWAARDERAAARRARSSARLNPSSS
jgi:exonuclease III